MNFDSRILKKRLGVMRKKRHLLLLCTGDTCRNPMATGYLQKLVKDMGVRDLVVRSAGVMTVNGLLPSDESAQMLEPFNVDISPHRSRPLTPELIQKAHLILGMTPIHVQTALRLSAEAKGKTFLLRDYAGTAEGKNSQVNDPMGCTLEVYKNCFKLIKKACDQLMKKPFVKELMVSKSPAKKPPAQEAAGKKVVKKSPPKQTARKPAAKAAAAAKAASVAKATSAAKATRAVKATRAAKTAAAAKKAAGAKKRKTSTKKTTRGASPAAKRKSVKR